MSGVCLSLVACSSGSSPLDELKTDPLAATSRPGAVLVTSADERRSTGFYLFKPGLTEVLRTFAPEDGDVDALTASVVSDAEAAGWQMSAPDEFGRSATKAFSFGSAELFVADTVVEGRSVVTLVIRPEDSNL